MLSFIFYFFFTCILRKRRRSASAAASMSQAPFPAGSSAAAAAAAAVALAVIKSLEAIRVMNLLVFTFLTKFEEKRRRKENIKQTQNGRFLPHSRSSKPKNKAKSSSLPKTNNV